VSKRPRSFEHRYRWMSVAMVGLFALAFAIGLGLHLTDPGGPGAMFALQAGLILLMVSPAVRMGVATAERLRKRDYAFAVMTLVVLLELGIVFWRSS
jgi:hypothetical protein